MIIKMFWEKCPEFIMEEEDSFVVEASQDEAIGQILPQLSPQEQVKFEQMKGVYIAKSTSGGAKEGCYYFLVSRGARTIKFESAAMLTADLSCRGGATKVLPDIVIASMEELDAVDPAKY